MTVNPLADKLMVKHHAQSLLLFHLKVERSPYRYFPVLIMVIAQIMFSIEPNKHHS